LAIVQWKVLAICDLKLGCDGGASTAVVFSAIVAFGASLVLALFAQGASALAGLVPSTRQGLVAALVVAAVAALWSTSAGWR